MSRPLVIVVSSGYHLYRQYLLAGISANARIWLLLATEPSWEAQYIEGWTKVDTLDAAAVVAAGRQITAQHEVSGVICWDELRTINAARLAEALGLPGGHADAIVRCRDKHLTRQSLDAAGVVQPTSRAVNNETNAVAVANEIGYPVVVKPRGLGASIGVSRVDDDAQLIAAYRHASKAFEDGVPPNDSVLIEQCIVGEEISIDSAIVGGMVQPLFIARKMLGFEPHCEEIGHVVDGADPLLTDPALIDLLQRAHSAVGYQTGITHTEVMLTSSGPQVIEINSRYGGDLIPYVASIAAGLDPGRIAVEVAVGQRPNTSRTQCQVARVDFWYPDTDVTVEQITISPGPCPPGVDRIVALAQPGQVLQLPPAGHVASRYGYIVTYGPTSAHCAQAAELARPLIQLSSHRLSPCAGAPA
jgi:biotin carboxylase